MIRAERHIETEKEVCGEITVFLSLILTCICALMGGLFESARAAGSGWYMQMALNSSLDSLMSCYHREIWDKYRIFVLECAQGYGSHTCAHQRYFADTAHSKSTKSAA